MLAILASLLLAVGGGSATGTTQSQTCPQYAEAFKRHRLPVDLFVRVAWRESRCNPKSVSAIRSNGYPDVGLVQIQGSWKTVTHRVCKLPKSANHLKALTKVDCNLAVARYLWERGGKNHWTATTNN